MNKLFYLLFLLIRPLCSADSTDWGKIINISLVGYVMVLLALFVIYLFMSALSRVIAKSYEIKENKQAALKGSGHLEIRNKKGRAPSLETVAAIMMAIDKTYELHREEEKAIMTIEKFVRPYSPWSSKLYAMRNQPWQTLKK